jgi:hypothetical protein
MIGKKEIRGISGRDFGNQEPREKRFLPLMFCELSI